jgi:hypothetical protein
MWRYLNSNSIFIYLVIRRTSNLFTAGLPTGLILMGVWFNKVNLLSQCLRQTTSFNDFSIVASIDVLTMAHIADSTKGLAVFPGVMYQQQNSCCYVTTMQGVAGSNDHYCQWWAKLQSFNLWLAASTVGYSRPAGAAQPPRRSDGPTTGPAWARWPQSVRTWLVWHRPATPAPPSSRRTLGGAWVMRRDSD